MADLRMVKKSVSIDVEDNEGVKYHLKITGPVTRTKLLKMFEGMNIVDLEKQEQPINTVGARIWNIVDKQYKLDNFTSTDVLEKYEDEYNMPIKLSIISTYLARYAQRGSITRQKRGRGWLYRAPNLGPTPR